MSQVEKKAGLLRRTSSSKKPLKEKVVLMYDEIFAKEDPAKNNPRFWDELFLMKVNLEYLESKLESVDGEEVQRIQDNINSLFHHCVQTLAEEHQIKVVNALQTLCALFRGVHQKNKSATGFDIINMLMGFDKAEQRMKVWLRCINIIAVWVCSSCLSACFNRQIKVMDDGFILFCFFSTWSDNK
uniref:Armadillo-like helical domain-containing protein n=1 Tax=Periophthalmus magnuspinnatus TaxID=409849 RepID=A0A3B4ASK4_9GOBI